MINDKNRSTTLAFPGHQRALVTEAPSSPDATYPGMPRPLIRVHRMGWLFQTVAQKLLIVSDAGAVLCRCHVNRFTHATTA